MRYATLIVEDVRNDGAFHLVRRVVRASRLNLVAFNVNARVPGGGPRPSRGWARGWRSPLWARGHRQHTCGDATTFGASAPGAGGDRASIEANQLRSPGT